MNIKPVTVQEAIKHLDGLGDRDFADAMVANLELGYVVAGRDEQGELHYRITEAGTRHAEDLIRQMGGLS